MVTTAGAIDLPAEEAIAFLRQKVAATSEDFTTIWQKANVKAFTVAGAATTALADDFHQATLKAIETGTTLADFRKDFDVITERHGWQHSGTPGWRSLIIYETNLSMAYAAGRYAQQTEPETLAAFPYWMYVHSGSLHPRHDHKSWDGLVLRADDPWWQTHYPPNGWRCGCWVRVCSARDLQRMGRSGPDKAPKIEYREWVNRKTGDKHQVPKGIDPGFDYNVGAEWKGEAKIPDYATLQPGRPIAAPKARPEPGPAAPAVSNDDPPPKIPPSPATPALKASGSPPAPANPLPAEAYLRATSGLEVQQADIILEQDYRGWSRSLDKVEALALKAYKGSAYRAMNTVLRTGARDADWEPMLANLDAALSRAKTRRPLAVFRGAAEGSPLRNAKVGDIIADSGFLSTSISDHVAAGFGGHPPVVVEIRLPKGYAGGAYVHRAPEIQLKEYEFLIRPGAPFRVVERTDSRIVVEPVRGRRRRTPAALRSPRQA